MAQSRHSAERPKRASRDERPPSRSADAPVAGNHRSAHRKPAPRKGILAGVVGASLVLVLAVAALVGPQAAERVSLASAGTSALKAARLPPVAPTEVSRGFERSTLPASPVVTKTNYTTAALLDIRTEPTEDAEVLTGLDRGSKVEVTGITNDAYSQIRYEGQLRWVTSAYLTDTKPPTISDAVCASGSGVESGLRPDTVKVHRAVCGAFPSITRYGGSRGSGGEHGVGRALDIMVSSGLGTQVAEFVKKYHRELGVSQVIWRQRIWTVQRSGDGWRRMSSRGSATANHFDHVHVTTYGNAAA
ncbi:hypothetical protein BH09ACT10_BH09ACT10_01980 [soil metagenome]